MKEIVVYTDGSCAGNPGIGGYASILTHNGSERFVTGHTTKITTNNKMELTAVIATIEWLNDYQKEPCKVIINTDSKYLMDCARLTTAKGEKKTLDWYKGRENGDLWLQLISLTRKGGHTIRFVKVPAHSGVELNERCDKLAKAECAKARHELNE